MSALLVIIVVGLTIWLLVKYMKADHDEHRASGGSVFERAATAAVKSAAESAGRNSKPAQVSKPSQPNLEMLPPRFVVYDLETTGLHAERHHVIEIAAIRVHRDSDRHDSFETLILPRGRISSRITELTGLDRKALLSQGIEIERAISDFREFVGNLPMVAFNASFDRSFLDAECRRLGLPAFPNKHDCALKAARKAWPGRSSYKLSAICRDAGISLENEHRALADCKRALLTYVAAVQVVGNCAISADSR